MLPQFYQDCFQAQLSPAQYLMLQMLVLLLQSHKDVRIERLAALFPQPILYESRRRSIQRFLVLPRFSIRALWFPLIKCWVKSYFRPVPQNRKQRRQQKKLKRNKQLLLVIDRSQWKERNLFMVSLVWEKRAIPIYWQILPKVGNSSLAEQQALLKPVLKLLKGYPIVLLADREFHSVKLANWLCQQNIGFVLRIKKNTYIELKPEELKQLQELNASPGTAKFLSQIQVTKQKGFGLFNVGIYWKRKYRGKVEDEPWYILTNLPNLQIAVSTFKARFGIEAMFKDCKTGGYNLEDSHASDRRLISLILLIAIAYTCSILHGRQFKRMGIQKYINRLQELHRHDKRHSSFWVGLYGQLWVGGMEAFFDLATALMRIKLNKLPYFQKGLRAMMLIQSTF